MVPFSAPGVRQKHRLQLHIVFVVSLICAASANAADPFRFGQVGFLTNPSIYLEKADEVEKIARLLKRACPRQSQMVWKSTRPADDLRKLAATIQGLKAISEKWEFPGGSLTSNQRLYVAESSSGASEFTLLWTAGADKVSLQICGDEGNAIAADVPSKPAEPVKWKCVQPATRHGRPLEADCEKNIKM